MTVDISINKQSYKENIVHARS